MSRTEDPTDKLSPWLQTHRQDWIRERKLSIFCGMDGKIDIVVSSDMYVITRPAPVFWRMSSARAHSSSRSGINVVVYPINRSVELVASSSHVSVLIELRRSWLNDMIISCRARARMKYLASELIRRPDAIYLLIINAA